MLSSHENDSGGRSQSLTSRSLIIRLRSNESQAWSDVVRLYSPLVFHWCQKAGLPNQECPDVVQEVFRAAFNGVAQFRHDSNGGGTFRGWLRTIARNKVVDFFRRNKNQPSATGGSEAAYLYNHIPGENSQLWTDELDHAAEHALFARAFEVIQRDVQQNTWEAFHRVVIEGKDAAIVAEELQMQPGAVRVAKSRVLRRLRELLGDIVE